MSGKPSLRDLHSDLMNAKLCFCTEAPAVLCIKSHFTPSSLSKSLIMSTILVDKPSLLSMLGPLCLFTFSHI